MWQQGRQQRAKLEQLQEEYESLPDFVGLCDALEQIRHAVWELEQVERQLQAAQEEEARWKNRKTEILQQLVMIRDRILNKETNCRNELSATSFALKERLCVYGHGVLLKPVLHRYIPQLEFEWAFDLYNKNHEEIKRRISEVVSKEGNENV